MAIFSPRNPKNQRQDHILQSMLRVKFHFFKGRILMWIKGEKSIFSANFSVFVNKLFGNKAGYSHFCPALIPFYV